MKNALLLFLCFFSLSTIAQPWSAAQLESANTAKGAVYLSQAEKDVILYINLCRLYPDQFAKNEVEPYQGVAFTVDVSFKKYKASLMKELESTYPVEELTPDEALFEDTKCHAAELYNNYRLGHKRIKCTMQFSGECLSFGTNVPKEIALQLLIDSGVSNLTHRKICLDEKFTIIGVTNARQKQYGFCSVIDFL